MKLLACQDADIHFTAQTVTSPPQYNTPPPAPWVTMGWPLYTSGQTGIWWIISGLNLWIFNLKKLRLLQLTFPFNIWYIHLVQTVTLTRSRQEECGQCSRCWSQLRRGRVSPVSHWLQRTSVIISTPSRTHGARHSLVRVWTLQSDTRGHDWWLWWGPVCSSSVWSSSSSPALAGHASALW